MTPYSLEPEGAATLTVKSAPRHKLEERTLDTGRYGDVKSSTLRGLLHGAQWFEKLIVAQKRKTWPQLVTLLRGDRQMNPLSTLWIKAFPTFDNCCACYIRRPSHPTALHRAAFCRLALLPVSQVQPIPAPPSQAPHMQKNCRNVFRALMTAAFRSPVTSCVGYKCNVSKRDATIFKVRTSHWQNSAISLFVSSCFLGYYSPTLKTDAVRSSETASWWVVTS
jgi:hypothetical protein